MDLLNKVVTTPLNTCCSSMRALWRTQCTVLLLSILCACTYGLSVDFSQLRQIRTPYILDKRGDDRVGNPCPSWQPFLCKSNVCIALDMVCDGHSDCPDHFDEDPELCTARRRPSVESIHGFLERNRKWMLHKLFSGADLELVAHALAVGTSLEDISLMIGLTPTAKRNLEDAFYAVLQNDMRPLLKLGMPKGEWYDTSNVLTQIVDGGLEI